MARVKTIKGRGIINYWKWTEALSENSMPYDREVKTRTCTKEMISCHSSPFLFSQLLIRKQDMCDAIYALAYNITWRFYTVLFFSTFLCRWKLNQKFNRRKSENISICKFEKKNYLSTRLGFLRQNMEIYWFPSVVKPPPSTGSISFYIYLLLVQSTFFQQPSIGITELNFDIAQSKFKLILHEEKNTNAISSLSFWLIWANPCIHCISCPFFTLVGRTTEKFKSNDS